MIIKFDVGIDDLLNCPADSLEEFICELSRASMRGYHYVVISRKVASWCMEHLHLSRRDRAQLDKLHREAMERFGFLRRAQLVLNVAVGTTGIERFGAQEFRIGHAACIRSEFLEKPVLLVENAASDGDFFGHILDRCRRKMGLKQLHYEIRHGGGTNIIRESSRLLVEKRVFCVIIDSDKLSPHCGPSSVAKSVKRELAEQTCAAALLVLPCRDVENLLPIDLIEKHNICPEYDFELFRKLERLHENREYDDVKESPLIYFDMKEGLSLKKIGGMSENSPSRKWLEVAFREKDERPISSISGFGDNLLTEFRKNGVAMSEFLARTQENEWWHHFAGIFCQALWIVAGDDPRRT